VLVVRWWVVANPRRWRWAQLFPDERIRFHFGQREKHYRQLKVGDVVVGYESSPGRRLAALARVSKPFKVHENDDVASFELAPFVLLKHGATWEELRADPLLARSEPMRCRNQGTLFALSQVESDQLIELLRRDAAVKSLVTIE
jgi:5-methylcytosine-specific restriction enzyme B